MNATTTMLYILVALALPYLSAGERLPCPGKICYEHYKNGTLVPGGNVGCCVKMGLECCPDGLYCVKNATAQCTANDGRSPPKKYKKDKGNSVTAPENPSEGKAPALNDNKCPEGICVQASTSPPATNSSPQNEEMPRIPGLLASFGRKFIARYKQ